MEAHYKSAIQKSSTERTKDRERDDALIERLRKSAMTIEQGATEERSSQRHVTKLISPILIGC
jgi:hypothetical protein